jgi:hypothetical protein
MRPFHTTVEFILQRRQEVPRSAARHWQLLVGIRGVHAQDAHCGGMQAITHAHSSSMCRIHAHTCWAHAHTYECVARARGTFPYTQTNTCTHGRTYTRTRIDVRSQAHRLARAHSCAWTYACTLVAVIHALEHHNDGNGASTLIHIHFLTKTLFVSPNPLTLKTAFVSPGDLQRDEHGARAYQHAHQGCHRHG